MEIVELHGHLREAGDMCARAFGDYPFLTAMFPGSGARRARIARPVYRNIVGDCLHNGLVHGAFADDRLVGVAAWLPPGAYPLAPLRQLRGIPSAIAVLANYPHRALLGLDAAKRLERNHPRSPHWYLAVIAVDPARQGEGIGRALVQPGLGLVDARDDPCFLETAKKLNADWYSRLGFETRLVEPAFDGGPDQWYMWRPPQADRA